MCHWPLMLSQSNQVDPQVQTIQGLIAASVLLQFSYTFPPLMQFAFDVHADASHEDGVYSATSGVQRKDTWKSPSRWRRGIFGGGGKRVAWKMMNVVIFTAALATSGLGIWGSVSDRRSASYDIASRSADLLAGGDYHIHL